MLETSRTRVVAPLDTFVTGSPAHRSNSGLCGSSGFRQSLEIFFVEMQVPRGWDASNCAANIDIISCLGAHRAFLSSARR